MSTESPISLSLVFLIFDLSLLIVSALALSGLNPLAFLFVSIVIIPFLSNVSAIAGISEVDKKEGILTVFPTSFFVSSSLLTFRPADSINSFCLLAPRPLYNFSGNENCMAESNDPIKNDNRLSTAGPSFFLSVLFRREKLPSG